MKREDRVGDKVALKNHSLAPLRGVITVVLGGTLRIETEAGELDVHLDEVTNYSAAARKAWSKQPHRRVGRPRGAVVDRVTVNLRLDRDLWTAFQAAELDGLIATRTETINKWLRVGLEKLQRGSRRDP